MLSKHLIPALAVISGAAAQTSTVCTPDGGTLTINSAAEATANLASCSSVKGSIKIGPNASGDIDISGPTTISGDVDVESNPNIFSLKSSSLTEIGGKFTIKNATFLNTLQMSTLNKVGDIAWQSLPRLQTLSFGTPGIQEASTLLISDTFLETLDGIDLTSVRNVDINNNGRLTKIALKLSSLGTDVAGDFLRISANGQAVDVSLPNLKWITNMNIANVTTFEAPLLQAVNNSANFDSNLFESLSAPNMTETANGTLSFVGNANLNNISFPVLSKLGGGLQIANNTALESIDGFPKLAQIEGAVKLRGVFKDFAFPSLANVVGAFDASSTNDITKSCDTLAPLASKSSGGTPAIQGVFSCTANNATANNDTGGTTSGTGSGSSSGNKGSAAGVVLNLALLGGLTAMGMLTQMW